ncbi:MAG: peptide ABC transporter substrate-binding protein, partial [Actinomycetota bacterium]
TRFTFTLRPDAKFSNGEPVTAESFVRGWTRGTARDEDGEVAYHLAGIKGYKEHHDDGTAAKLSGVLARDENILEVTLTEPDADFVTKTGHSSFMPIPSDETIKAQKPSWGEFPIGNGPFMLKGPEPWKHNQSITMVPNPNYVGSRPKPTLDEVRFVIFADQQTAYTEFQAGNLDWTRIPPEKVKEAEEQNPGNFIKQATAGLDFLDLLVTRAPTDNKKFRQAISLAVDRKLINDAIFNGLRQPADSIIPPLMPGYKKGACKLCRHDPAMAKKLFQESGVEVRGKLPLQFNAGGSHEQWMQAVGDQIKTNLGIDYEFVTKGPPLSEYLEYLRGDAAPGGVSRLGWGMDYPTPQNFLFPLLHSAANDNYSKYKNPEFEALLTKAGAETDTAKRLQ